MSIVPINIGGQANDGNGQTLRSGGALINANFAELDTRTAAAQETAEQGVTAAGAALNAAQAAQTKADAAIPGSAAGVSVAQLVGGKIPVNQLPPLAVNEVFTVASQAAMLALVAERGDVAIRSDQSGQAYILSADAPSVLANWIPLAQSLSVALAAINPLVPAANRVPVYTGPSSAGLLPVQASPTDATPGALMGVGAFGLGALIIVPSQDVNTLTNFGFFYVTGSTNAPYQNGWLTVRPISGAYCVQEFISESTGIIYTRALIASTWQGWKIAAGGGVNSDITSLTGLTTALSVAQGGTGVTTMASLLSALITSGAYAKSNAVGTVSQAAGIPTGALMEYGSNANGQFWKFACGTMICTFRGTATLGLSVQYVGTMYYTSISWTFPSAFVGVAPSHHCGAAKSGNITYTATSAGESLTGATYFVVEHSGTIPSATYNINWMAIGRWF